MRRVKINIAKYNHNNSEIKLTCILLIIQMLILVSGDCHPNPGPKKLIISHSNVRSIKSEHKIQDIKNSLSKVDIMTVSETWLDSKDDNNNLLLKNYSIPYRRDRPHNLYGEVLVWVANHIISKRQTDLESPDIEILWIEVKLCDFSFLLGTIYKPPNTDHSFWENLDNMLQIIEEQNLMRTLIIGDFNSDPNTINGRKLLSLMDSHLFGPCINEPTRITDSSSTILDQCFVNTLDLVDEFEVTPPIYRSDHCTIKIELNITIKTAKPYKRRMWKYTDHNLAEYKKALNKKNINIAQYSDVNIAVKTFTDTVLQTAETCIQNKCDNSSE